MQKIIKNFTEISIESLPVIAMILLIPLIRNDYLLALVYLIVIVIAFIVKYEKKEVIFFLFGFFIMIISEYFFISTGVEIFVRKSLFGSMPFWLPILWGYGFVAIKRAIKILEK